MFPVYQTGQRPPLGGGVSCWTEGNQRQPQVGSPACALRCVGDRYRESTHHARRRQNGVRVVITHRQNGAVLVVEGSHRDAFCIRSDGEPDCVTFGNHLVAGAIGASDEDRAVGLDRVDRVVGAAIPVAADRLQRVVAAGDDLRQPKRPRKRSRWW